MDAMINIFTVLMWEYPQPPQIGQCSKEMADVMVHGPPIFLKPRFHRWELHRLAEEVFTMRVLLPHFRLKLLILDIISVIGQLMQQGVIALYKLV